MARNLDDWVDSYIAYLENTETPTIYKRWTAIATIAAALQRKCYISWEKHAQTYPNMYIVLVGPAALGKGIAMGPASNMLRDLNVKMSAQSTTRQALIEDLCAATTSLATGTSTGIIDMGEHSSLTIFSKEFSVFLGHQNVELIANLTDWFDCEDPWTYKTKGRGEETVRGICVNLIGATTPNIFVKSLTEDAISGGLTSRIVLVYADKKERVVPIPAQTDEERKLYIKLKTDLDKILVMKGEFKFTKAAVDAWVEWYIDQRSNFCLKGDHRFEGYEGRRKIHLLKLLMIYSASRSEKMIIDLEDMERSLQTLYEAERAMPNAYRGYGRSELSDVTNRIMKTIEMSGVVYESTLLKANLGDISSQELTGILQTLVRCGYCKMEVSNSGKMAILYTPENVKL